ncbi:MAG: hypothetical protein IT477_10365 [Rhodanobacteraceae bacterium]|nr:hypothetical protein [Rhodanobacteraceae bacterium]
MIVLLSYDDDVALRAPWEHGSQGVVALAEDIQGWVMQGMHGEGVADEQAVLSHNVLSAPRALFFEDFMGGPYLSTHNATGDAPHPDDPDAEPRDEDEEDDGREEGTLELVFADGQGFSIKDVATLSWIGERPTFEDVWGDEPGEQPYEEALERFFADPKTLDQGLATYPNLSRDLASHVLIPSWAAQRMLMVPDLETIEAVAANPSLPERFYHQAAAALEAWLKNPAVPLYALVNPSPEFLGYDAKQRLRDLLEKGILRHVVGQSVVQFVGRVSA